MSEQQPFTIEILGLDHDRLAIVDRVIGGSVYIEEAKRIGERLLAVADAEKRKERKAFSCRDSLGNPINERVDRQCV